MSEPRNVFHDPAGRPSEPHSAGSAGPARPQTAEQWINHAYNDIDKHFVWEAREGQLYCHVCAPGGYRLKKGADPNVHATQRNPDKHLRNLRWMVIQWFRAMDMTLPGWPDAYRPDRSGTGLLFCHICRGTVGWYGEEDGRKHDALHLNMKQDIMRPNRVSTDTSAQKISKQPRKEHILDKFMKAQRGEGVEVHIRDEAIEPYEQTGSYKQSFMDLDAPSLIPGPRVATQFQTIDGQLMDTYELVVPDPRLPDQQWCRGCVEELCVDHDSGWKCMSKEAGCQHGCGASEDSAPEQNVENPQ